MIGEGGLTQSFAFQILKAFAKDDSLFVENCRRLTSLRSTLVSMPQYEFRDICDTKLESISRRISSYQQVTPVLGLNIRLLNKLHFEMDVWAVHCIRCCTPTC